MKFRHIAAALLALSALCLAPSCNSRPDGISDEMYNYAESTIKAVDAYLDNQVSFDDTFNKIKGLYDSAEQYSSDADHSGNMLTYIDIGLVRSDIYDEHIGIDTYADLLKSRNTLAKQIGYSERD